MAIQFQDLAVLPSGAKPDQTGEHGILRQMAMGCSLSYMAVGSRRELRRNQTIDEILTIAVEVMAEVGVAGLSLSEVARRLGIRPPSLYKYFPSRLALFDRLFQLGHQQHLDDFRAGAGAAEPGLPALINAVQAGGRWAMVNQSLAQLLFWRPVPGFEPSAEAYAPSRAMADDVRRMLGDAVERGQLGPGAATAEGAAVLSILVTGMLSQQLANNPGESFEDGQFTRLAPQIFAMFRDRYPPTEEPHGNSRAHRTAQPATRRRGR
jgi:AcrR family transcriptional regulator